MQALPEVAKRKANAIQRNMVSSKTVSPRKARHKSVVTARSDDLRFSPKAHSSSNTAPPPCHQQRAAHCELQVGVFKKNMTQERRHRPIRGYKVFTQSTTEGQDYCNGAFKKVTTSANTDTASQGWARVSPRQASTPPTQGTSQQPRHLRHCHITVLTEYHAALMTMAPVNT
jgi:hypothetical protein